LTAPPIPKPEPGTEAYYEANQNHLCTFLLALAKGYRCARTEDGTEIPPSVWRDRRAAMLIIDDSPDKAVIRKVFGPSFASPITIGMDPNFNFETINRLMGIDPADIKILRRYYRVTLKPERPWHSRKIVRDFSMLLARTPGPNEANARA
jgi:hypothetical protein